MKHSKDYSQRMNMNDTKLWLCTPHQRVLLSSAGATLKCQTKKNSITFDAWKPRCSLGSGNKRDERAGCAHGSSVPSNTQCWVCSKPPQSNSLTKPAKDFSKVAKYTINKKWQLKKNAFKTWRIPKISKNRNSSWMYRKCIEDYGLEFLF